MNVYRLFLHKKQARESRAILSQGNETVSYKAPFLAFGVRFSALLYQIELKGVVRNGKRF